MDLNVRGRDYLITGGSGTLGCAAAAALIADGANVTLLARSASRLEDAAERLRATGAGRAAVLVGDLCDPLLPDAVAALAPSQGWAGAIFSGGGPPHGATADISDEQWTESFDHVHRGPLRLATALLETAGQPLALTFVLSTAIRQPTAGLAVSATLRAGLAVAAKTLADEYGPSGHRVNVILPGRIDTARARLLDATRPDANEARRRSEKSIPLRRYGRPEEFGRAAAFLTSPAASYISGSTLTVDGGLTRFI